MRFVYLHAPASLIKERMKSRHHPYMNPDLLDSQLATLEVPSDAWAVSVSGKPEEAVAEIITRLREAGLRAAAAGEIMTTNIFSLEGKTAVVIGGTSGIGRTLSLGLADAGADVIASARRREQIDETAAEIERHGRQTLRLCSDVRNRASLEELLAAYCGASAKWTSLLTAPEKSSACRR